MTALATRDAVEVEAHGSAPRSRLGQVPLIALLAAIGLLLCALANALSRATLDPPMILYLGGIAVIGLPIFWRLNSREPSNGERIALVSLLGLALYGVKLVRDGLLFRTPDEFIHAFNAEQIVRDDALFGDNPVLRSSADFPGLEGATSALMDLTGLSSYGAGMLTVGAARLAMMVALYLLFRRMSGSARVAGLGAAIYTANFSFIYFDGQYSYESLALPLLIVALVAVAERAAPARPWSGGWGVAIVLLTAAIVVTHHLSSYALTAALIALALLYWLVERRWGWDNPWPFAALALALSAAWLVGVAEDTVDYLSPVFTDAATAAFETATGEAAGRALFEAAPTAADVTTPLLPRIVALASLGILALALPLGLREVWRRYRGQPFALLACLAAVGFFVLLGLRLVPGAWETANRATEFLYIGLAFVVALAVVVADSWLRQRSPHRTPWLGRALLSALLGVVLVGGAISGWPWDAHLVSPIRATAQGREIESESFGLARWVSKRLPNERFAASNAEGRMIIAYGDAFAIAGGNPDVEDILASEVTESWHVPLLRRNRLRYVVANRLRRSGDTTRGYSFTVRPPVGEPESLFPRSTVRKFETTEPSADVTARISDSGNIVVYDLQGRR